MFDKTRNYIEELIPLIKAETLNEFQPVITKFDNVGSKIKTFGYLARRDSPELYQKWLQNNYYPAMLKAQSGLDLDIVEAIYQIYWLDFIYINKNWYIFNKIWIPIEESILLNKCIQGLIKRYKFLLTALNNHVKRNELNDYILMINKILTKIYKKSIQKDLIKGLRDRFYDDKIENIIIQNKDLLGCKPYCLQFDINGKEHIRLMLPEDYIFKNLGVNYPFLESDDSMMNILKRLFSNQKINENSFSCDLDIFLKFQYEILVSCSKSFELLIIIVDYDIHDTVTQIQKLLSIMWGDYSSIKYFPSNKKNVINDLIRLELMTLTDSMKFPSNNFLLDWLELGKNNQSGKLILCNFKPNIKIQYKILQEKLKIINANSLYINKDKMNEYAASLFYHIINYK